MTMHPQAQWKIPSETERVALTDQGFDFSVLSEWRQRLITDKLQESILQMQREETISWEDAKAKLGI